MNKLTAIITKILGIFTIVASLLMIAGYPFGIPVLENSLAINTMPFNADNLRFGKRYFRIL